MDIANIYITLMLNLILLSGALNTNGASTLAGCISRLLS